MCGPDYLSLNDLGLVQRKLWETRAKWYNVGLGLKIMATDLEAIQQECGENIEKCFTKMLYKWLCKSRAEHRCTWKTIVNMLKTNVISCEGLANKIENEMIIVEDRNSSDMKSQLDPLTYPVNVADLGKLTRCM